MSDGAIRKDVIEALRNQPGIRVEVVPDGTVEVAKVGVLRRWIFQPVVSRGTLGELERLYDVPMAAFYPRTSMKPQTDAAGE